MTFIKPSKLLRGLCLLLLSWAPLGGAYADTSINAQGFKPSPFMDALYNLDTARLHREGFWDVGTYLNYQKDPLILRERDSEAEIHAVVAHQLTLDLLGAYAITHWLDVGVGVPITPFQRGEGMPGGESPSTFALGDARLHARALLWENDAESLMLAFTPTLSLPTATDEFTGMPGFALMPKLSLTADAGRVELTTEMGYHMVRNGGAEGLDLYDELVYALGLQVWIAPERWAGIVTFDGSTTAEEPFAASNQSPLELMSGVRYFLEDWIQFDFGAGLGLSDGYGSPDFRLFAGLVVSKEPPPKDTDGDGLVDPADKCVEVPEDRDGFEDSDGCPEPDNDKDGVLDPWISEAGQVALYKDHGAGSDACPMEPEDKDGFEDEDGCPDPDNDRDGVLDAQDKCPTEPEDLDKFKDADGCPDPDNDHDKICDPWVAAQSQLEAYEGVCAGADQCPTEPEIYNGKEDEDGCPDANVKVSREKIEILEKVYFFTNKTEIMPKSHDILNDVAAVLAAHPHLKRVRVEGHTDTRGGARSNRALSDGRAKAVMAFLISKGVAPERLEAKGYGEDRPVVKKARTEAQHEQNRRVEFLILEADYGDEEGEVEVKAAP